MNIHSLFFDMMENVFCHEIIFDKKMNTFWFGKDYQITHWSVIPVAISYIPEGTLGLMKGATLTTVSLTWAPN